jgi:hypothetical protein
VAPTGVLTRAVLVVTAAAILVLGLFPSPLTQWSAEGAMLRYDDLPRLLDARDLSPR